MRISLTPLPSLPYLLPWFSPSTADAGGTTRGARGPSGQMRGQRQGRRRAVSSAVAVAVAAPLVRQSAVASRSTRLENTQETGLWCFFISCPSFVYKRFVGLDSEHRRPIFPPLSVEDSFGARRRSSASLPCRAPRWSHPPGKQFRATAPGIKPVAWTLGQVASLTAYAAVA